MIQAVTTTIIEFPDLGWGPWTWDRFVFRDLFGGLSVAWYGLIICLGMILGCTVVLRNATKKEGFLADSFLDYFLFCIPVAVIGARIMYVASKWEEYDSFLEMVSIWKGGIAIYGAVIAGAVTVFIVAAVKKHRPMKVLDAMIPGLLLGQAIGRWGNFVNGEAHGGKTDLPWGMMINGEGPFHPTFLYESLITFSGFLLAMLVIYRLKKKLRVDGMVFCFYLVWYGIGRTLVEGLRTDSLYVGSFRLAQCIGIFTSLAGIVLFVILFMMRKNRSEAVLAEGKKEEAADENVSADEKGEEGEEKEEEKEEKEEKEENGSEETEKNEPEEKETEDGTDH